MSDTRRVPLICAAAGVANLELIDELGLVENAGVTGAYFRKSLTEALAGHKHVGDVCGDGMLAAVEFVQDQDNRAFFDPSRRIGPQVAAALLERGVIGRAMPQGDILGFAPPLCLTKDGAANSLLQLNPLPATSQSIRLIFSGLFAGRSNRVD